MGTGNETEERGLMEKKQLNEKKLPVEVYFLRYAFPCAFVAKDRGEITENEYQNLETAAREGFILSRPVLEKIFHNAFDHIRNLSRNLNKDKWEYEVIEEYFTSYHNHVIDKGSYANVSEKMKDLSRVKLGTITLKKDDVLEIDFGNQKRFVLDHFVPEAKVGDKVTVHYGYAVEIV